MISSQWTFRFLWLFVIYYLNMNHEYVTCLLSMKVHYCRVVMWRKICAPIIREWVTLLKHTDVQINTAYIYTHKRTPIHIFGSVINCGIFGSFKWGSGGKKSLSSIRLVTTDLYPVCHCFTIAIFASPSHHLNSEVMRKSQPSLGYCNKPSISCRR